MELLQRCEHPCAEIVILTEQLHKIISDPGVGEAELIDAIGRLGPVTEPAGFWAALANSDNHSLIQRRHYVLQLFRRHIRPGMRLSTLALMLDDPQWLNPEDLEVIEDLGGSIPVQMTAGDTVFKLRVMPNRGLPDVWAVYFRVAGKITRDQLYTLLHEHVGDEAIALAEILQIGFSPPTVQSVLGTQAQ
jgi:hypothetical protein